MPLVLSEKSFKPCSVSSIPAIICSALELKNFPASVRLILLKPLLNNLAPTSSSNFEICCDKEGWANPNILDALV